MEIIWAPWRIGYIKSNKEEEGCIFCSKPAEKKDKKNHIFLRYPTCFAMLNRFPYNNGHVLVSPYEHISTMDQLSKKELLEMMEMVRDCVRLLQLTISPQGFNIGLNLGLPAGAGIADHLHFHIVPRWEGDTNFMPATANTKIIPQALDTLYNKLRASAKKNL